MPDIHQLLATSDKIDFESLDWAAARAAGLSPRERAALQFFVDIESQTVFYMLEVAKLEVARAPELLAFLTMWNYEEYFHAIAITRLLSECGHATEDSMRRATDVRGRARLRARLEDLAQVALARSMPETFVALWMAWGASQELLTCHAYEELTRTTANPVLAELARRIGKQERRHFAYYFGAARERLAGKPFAQRVVRTIFARNWNPVGSGVKSPAEHAEMIARLFPGHRLGQVMGAVERRMATLPGLAGLDACSRWMARAGLDGAAPSSGSGLAAAA